MTLNKNLWVIPTDNKYSRLYFNVNDKEFQICEIEKPSTILKPNRHIYITNDEEIKEGDWCVDDIGDVFKIEYLRYFKEFCKKIILTTDQDLIKDGVQAIDDEFLGWFVQNPSCEGVDIDAHVQSTENGHILYYQIMIPKDEPKQETLEEAIDRVAKEDGYDIEGGKVSDFVDGMVKGYKLSKERSYSEEDMKSAFKVGFSIGYGSDVHDINEKNRTCEEWFEQFKKK